MLNARHGHQPDCDDYYGQSVYPEVHAYLKASGLRQAAEVYRNAWFSDYLYIRG